MICPCCKQPKEKDDFYWRGFYKANKECKTCHSEIMKQKREEKKNEVSQYFDVDKFAKQMLFQ